MFELSTKLHYEEFMLEWKVKYNILHSMKNLILDIVLLVYDLFSIKFLHYIFSIYYEACFITLVILLQFIHNPVRFNEYKDQL